MLKHLLSIILTLAASSTFAQDAPVYLKIAVHLDDDHPLPLLASLGVEIEHAQLFNRNVLIHYYDQFEVKAIVEAGFHVDTLIADYHAWYARMLEADAAGLIHVQPRNVSCSASKSTDHYPVPNNYQGGPVGGYVTYNQMIEQLHAMHLFRPDLITDTIALSQTLLTHEGRRLYMLRISDNASTDEPNEPEVLYTALHHAREPNSLSQLLFFMWYLLENYNTDPLVKAIVDNTELYFVPCVNPDGYVYNETTNPNGGGMWRKNRRNNGTNFGVDLNRNYGFMWGLDNVGSSPNTNASTYRGPAAFSEPETQLIRNLCNDHNFVLALNNHTYSNLWNFVWGYTYDPVAERHAYEAHSRYLSRHNSYPFGAAELLYLTNGVSDDWMYGDPEKNTIYAYTPEVGPTSFGFWPPPSQIIRLNQEMMTGNLRAALSAHPWADTHPSPPAFSPIGTPQTLQVAATGVCFKGGQVNIGLASLHPLVTVLSGNQTFTFSTAGDTQTISLQFLIDNQVPAGTPIGLVVKTSNGFYTQSDTVFTLAGQGNTLYQSSDFSDWDGNFWQASDGVYIADNNICPQGNLCKANLTAPIQIPAWGHTSMLVKFRYNVEANPTSALSIKLGLPNGNTQPLCGRYNTNNASSDFQPIYRGYFGQDILETFDLTEFTGQSVQPLFELVHGGVEENSVVVSSVQIVHVEPTVDTRDTEDTNLTLVPNPSNGIFKLSRPDITASVRVFNTLGQTVYHGQGSVFDLTDRLPNGVYYACVTTKDKPDVWQTIVLAR